MKLACAFAALAASSGLAAAQGLSDAEIAARFQQQLEVFQEVRENPGLGPARGLVLTNVAPAAESAPGATVEGTSIRPPEPGQLTPPANTDTLNLPAEAAAATGTEPPLAHWSLPRESQVNVQVRFAFDSAALEDDAEATLRQICGVLDEAGVAHLRIVGHTDASGSASYNQQLSVLRSEEVQRFFVNDCGIAADRLEAIGVGEQFPYDAADPFAGANRRVEFQAMS